MIKSDKDFHVTLMCPCWIKIYFKTKKYILNPNFWTVVYISIASSSIVCMIMVWMLNVSHRLQIRCSSAEVSSWRQELHGRDATGRSLYQATPSSPAISSNSKESYLSAISKERSRPPSLLLSTAKGGVRSQMTFAYMDCGLFLKWFLKVTWEIFP